MASTTDATYTPRVYREHGGENLIIASSGDLYVQSGGDLIIESGGTLQLDSGSSCTVATNFEMASGYYVSKPVATLRTSQKATTLKLGTIIGIEASSTGPIYTLATPAAGADVVVSVSAVGATTTVTGTAIVKTGSTAITMSATGGTQLTMNGLDQTVIFHGKSTTRWYVTKPTTVAFGVT